MLESSESGLLCTPVGIITTNRHLCVQRGSSSQGVRGAVDRGHTKDIWSETEREGERLWPAKSKQDEGSRVRGWRPCEGVPQEQEGGGRETAQISQSKWHPECTTSAPYMAAKRDARSYVGISADSRERVEKARWIKTIQAATAQWNVIQLHAALLGQTHVEHTFRLDYFRNAGTSSLVFRSTCSDFPNTHLWYCVWRN